MGLNCIFVIEVVLPCMSYVESYTIYRLTLLMFPPAQFSYRFSNSLDT